MMRRRLDSGALTAGLVVSLLGTLLLLDRLDALDLSFGWLFPLAAAAVGAILLAMGLADRSP